MSIKLNKQLSEISFQFRSDKVFLHSIFAIYKWLIVCVHKCTKGDIPILYDDTSKVHHTQKAVRSFINIILEWLFIVSFTEQLMSYCIYCVYSLAVQQEQDSHPVSTFGMSESQKHVCILISTKKKNFKRIYIFIV